MPALKRARSPADDMHRKTAMLAEAADDAGDEFLQYLYAMALRHIEEAATAPTGAELTEQTRVRLQLGLVRGS